MEEDDRRRKAREEGRSSARFVPDGAEPRDNRWPAARSARFVPDGAEAREERRSAARFVSDGAEAHDQRWPAARFSTDGAGTDVPRRGAPTRTSAQGAKQQSRTFPKIYLQIDIYNNKNKTARAWCSWLGGKKGRVGRLRLGEVQPTNQQSN